MSDISNKFIVVTMTQDETKIWATGIEKGKKPEKIFAPTKHNHHHFRNDAKLAGSKTDVQTVAYFEDISAAISEAAEILIIGHGHGKASSMLHFIEHLERKHPATAQKIVDALDENIIALTEPEILKLARDWVDHHRLMD